MAVQNLLDFIKAQVTSEKQLSEVKQVLLTQRWTQQQIDEAVSQLGYGSQATNNTSNSSSAPQVTFLPDVAGSSMQKISNRNLILITLVVAAILILVGSSFVGYKLYLASRKAKITNDIHLRK